MGRRNTCVRGKYEGLYYIDNDNFEALKLDEDENPVKDKLSMQFLKTDCSIL